MFYTGNVKGDKGERISYQCKGILEENGQLKNWVQLFLHYQKDIQLILEIHIFGKIMVIII